MALKKITRKEARRLGLTRYFTGKPCKRGHVDERYVRGSCVVCARQSVYRYQYRNWSAHVKWNREWRRKNRDKIEAKRRARYPERAKKINAARRRRLRTDTAYAAELRARKRADGIKHRAKRTEQKRRWRQANREHVRSYFRNYNKGWCRNNPDKFREKRRRDQRRRMEKPIHRLKARLRSRLHDRINSKRKQWSFVRDLGCSVEQLKAHIESMFTSRMRWSNWGTYWQLDHIKHLASFDLTNRKQFLQACHYSNLQPLTIAAHRRKTAQERSAAACIAST